jgi:hypothetical protein
MSRGIWGRVTMGITLFTKVLIIRRENTAGLSNMILLLELVSLAKGSEQAVQTGTIAWHWRKNWPYK